MFESRTRGAFACVNVRIGRSAGCTKSARPVKPLTAGRLVKGSMSGGENVTTMERGGYGRKGRTTDRLTRTNRGAYRHYPTVAASDGALMQLDEENNVDELLDELRTARNRLSAKHHRFGCGIAHAAVEQPGGRKLGR